MKKTLTILIIIIYSCSAKQKTKDTPNTNVVKRAVSDNSAYSLQSNISCQQDKLSYQFDVEINLRRYTDTTAFHDSCILKVFIKKKETPYILDSLSVTSFFFFYYETKFANCDSLTSYSTGLNSSREPVDNYFGDIVVADFNFDHMDDLAVINDSGGNGGPLYNYYIQTKENKFLLDNFLTDSMTYFPSKIDKKKKNLVTYVHAGACCVGEHVYHLDKNTNMWKQISHKILDYNED